MERLLTKKDVEDAFDNMIVSASGWRAVFNVKNDDESQEHEITPSHAIISYVAAQAFTEFLRSSHSEIKEIIVGKDGRPTGNEIAVNVMRSFQDHACDFDLKFTHEAPIPQVISYANYQKAAFFYITASHNPVGYNGFKFGTANIGVLRKEEADKLLVIFKKCLKDFEIDRLDDIFERSKETKEKLDDYSVEATLPRMLSQATYVTNFVKIVTNEKDDEKALEIYESYDIPIKNMKRPIYVLVDYNGSARSHSLDKEVCTSIGINFLEYNKFDIVHGIIPEGDNLNYISNKLEEVYKKHNGHGIFLAYMPDCDGDRGNIVYMSDDDKATILKSQEVLAITTFSNIIHKRLVGTYEKMAIVVYGPTSHIIDEIASILSLDVFRAEVGESNVVNLGFELEKMGYEVVILGEGSNGGCIIPPLYVRDPMNSLFAILKLFFLQESLGIFEEWQKALGIKTKDDVPITFSRIVNSLPSYSTTPVAEKRAMLKIKIENGKRFKEVFQKVFLEEWDHKKRELKEKYGIESYKAVSYIGTKTQDVSVDFSLSSVGGFKIIFYDGEGIPISFIWMRSSGTEPVFRLMADVKNVREVNSSVAGDEDEIFFVSWEKEMIERSVEIIQKEG